VHKAGEKLFVDYSGQTLPVVNLDTGEIVNAQIFACLGASNYTFAEATPSQELPHWIGSHQRALAFLGGVPRCIVPDNLKSGVTHLSRYERGVNPSYQEFATHYGVAIIPARPHKPRDKCAQQGQTVRYFRSSDLIMELKLAKADGSWRKLQRPLAACDLLIIDDWLRDPLSLGEARDLLDLLDERYRKASCLFATQLPLNQWHQHIHAPTLADAMLDWVVHDAIRIILKGESMRKLTSQVKPEADLVIS
jgi:IstB-like ATP binding protein/Integrase core domain